VQLVLSLLKQESLQLIFFVTVIKAATENLAAKTFTILIKIFPPL
jgi:hypothetical protein